MTTLSTPAQVLLGSLIANRNALLFNIITEELNQKTITEEGYLLAEVCFLKHIDIVQQAIDRPVQQDNLGHLLELIGDYKRTDSVATLEAIASLVDGDYEVLCPIMASHGITY